MKEMYDEIVNPLGFEFIECVANQYKYAHTRAPIVASIYFSGGMHRCRLSYQVDSIDFSEMVTKTNLNKDFIVSALHGFKRTLTKLGIE